MTKKRALLMVKVDPPIERESEWNSWYNKRHVAALMNIPGFLSARRFSLVEGVPKQYAVAEEAKYLALYDLANVNVLKAEPYQKLREKETVEPLDSFDATILRLPKFACGVYEQIFPEQGDYTVPPTKLVFVIGHEVPRNKQKEYNVWYNTEHFPGQLSVPGFITGRRFMLTERGIPPIVNRGGPLPKYVTVYDIESEHVFETEVWRRAAVTPWSDWVRSWYTRKMCALYQQVYPKH